jgi:adenine deaminase
MTTPELLAAARGDRPADLVLSNARVVNVLSGEIEQTDVAVAGGVIVGIGPGYRGALELDLRGDYLLPGFIDAHVHIESSLVAPFEFARAVVPRGTTTVVCDPHEIANVHGLEGIRYMLDASEGLPLSVLVMASSCVPATPMGTAGAALDAAALLELARHPRVLGLAEVMNFPGVIAGDADMLEKIEAFRSDGLSNRSSEAFRSDGLSNTNSGIFANLAKNPGFRGRPFDGHAPRVRGQPLNAYVLAGPSSDHESTTGEEAREKIARGLFLFVREATNAHNMKDLLPALTPAMLRRAAFCTDDRTPGDLLDQGGIDMMVRFAIRSGIDPIEAIRMATLNPADHFGLRDRGAIAPGRRADLIAVDSLERLAIREVWSAGVLATENAKALQWKRPVAAAPAPNMRVDLERLSFRIEAAEETPPSVSAAAKPLSKSIRLRRSAEEAVAGSSTAPASTEPIASTARIASTAPISATGTIAATAPIAAMSPPASTKRARVIRVIPDQIVTGRDEEAPTVSDGQVVADPSRDLLKIAVIERHTGSGRVGLGLVRGMGLRSGAIAGTVAHDHHNLIVIGADDASMHAAARAVVEMEGGLAVASPDRVLARVPLPVGGLMSEQAVEIVRTMIDRATSAAHSLGCPLHDPFMAMSFLGLEVIPSLKITDLGVVDVEQFAVVGMWI